MGRRRKPIPWRLRLLGGLALAAAVGGGVLWWQFIHWTPSRAEFPVQGVLAGERDGTVNFASFKAIGADFAYLEASRGARGRDAMFPRNLERIRSAGLQFGVVHRYDPCVPADRQAANFVTIVPRDAAELPPAIELDALAEHCPERVSDAGVESELTTFLNQVEGHVGKPAILKVSPAFEDRYGIAARMERNLWLESNRFQPDYGGRPWMLWTANSFLRTEAGDNAVRWVVVQP